jgi:hypothetical protein
VGGWDSLARAKKKSRGQQESSPQAIIRDGTIRRSVDIFGTVEEGDDELEEVRADDLLFSALSTSPELR